MRWEATQRIAQRQPEGGGLFAHQGLDKVSDLLVTLGATERGPLLKRMTKEHFASPGKMVRARLAFAVAEVYGVSRSRCVPWAAAVELLHNATLVHDDIQDEDRVRRGAPTTWARHGVAQAINLGDQLLMLPTQAIEQLMGDEAMKWRLARCVSRRARATVAGQVEDLALGPDSEWTWAAYRRAVEGKTGHLLSLPVEGSLILARYTPDEAQAVADLFLTVGMLYQLQDDVLDIFGDKQREQTASDLYEGKVSALVIADSLLHPEHTDSLRRLLSTPRALIRRADVDETVNRFRDHGALDVVLGEMRNLRDQFLGNEWGQLTTLAQELITVTLRPIQGVWK